MSGLACCQLKGLSIVTQDFGVGALKLKLKPCDFWSLNLVFFKLSESEAQLYNQRV